MANRYFKQFVKTLDSERVLIDGYAGITDSVGSVSFPAGQGGVASITRNSAGNYSIVLQDQYPALLYPDVNVMEPSGVAGWDVVWTTLDPVITKTFRVQFLNQSGNAADLPPQSGFYFSLMLKNSTLGRGK